MKNSSRQASEGISITNMAAENTQIYIYIYMCLILNAEKCHQKRKSPY